MANEKKTILNDFIESVDSDTADNLLAASRVRFFLNCQVYGVGNKGQVTNKPGTLQVPNLLPAGNNRCIGWGSNEEQNKFYWFNYNDQNAHGIYCYNDTNQTVIPVIRNLTDTNNVDIFGFNPDFLINHVDIIHDNLIYWVDGLNKARKFNIDKAVDKTNAGYGTIILEDYITAYKKTAPYPILPVYFTDITKSSNYLYGSQFKFAQILQYDDGEISNANDFGTVPLPPNESFIGADSITNNNNCINVPLFTGSKLVTQIQVLVKILSGFELPWQTVVILNKAQLVIPDNSTYIFPFYNDLPLTPVDNVKVNRPYSFLPDKPYVQSFVKLAMTYGNFPEGFPTVPILANVEVTSKDLFLPNDTVTKENMPQFLVTLTSSSSSDTFFGGGYITTVTHFIIGFDVKKGNTFVLTGRNGAQDNYYQPFTAGYSDTAETVASAFKAFLRTTGRGVPDYRNGISNELTDGSGNVSWDYTYLGHWSTNGTVWNGSVNPVNYSTLTNDGTSVNVIKSGGPRKYAIVYEDSDGRKSLAYTNNALLATTPFLTQWGTAILQQPIHTISVFNQPPAWAFYWYLVRTKDITDFVQMLIQQVTSITLPDGQAYLDLIVGSLYTYQLINPDTIIQYEFQRGDRVRLIRNDSSLPGTIYPYFDTEVLSYKEVEEQTITAQITCDGSSDVTPSDGPKSQYIGKNIIINGAERTITGITGGNYNLNEPINPNLANPLDTNLTSNTTFPSYIIIDRRGILRINKPPASITIVNDSLVEVYRPQVNANNESKNDQYQDFQEFGVKFSVSNPGTPTAAHLGNIQNQDGSDPINTPSIIQITQGEAYFRNRALPTNVPVDPNNPNDVQIIVDSVEDPNFSDFYASNLYSLGRVYPQDDGSGQKIFDQRERFSNNYIQDTKINGLNDFDNTDRKDYNDAYGAIILSRFRRGYLFMFKALHTTWTAIKQRRITSLTGDVGLATSDELLNELEYAELEVGIGNNGESWFESDGHQYYASAASGVFIRVAQDGSIPISELYFYDKTAREVLSTVSKYNLRIFGGYDKPNTEAIWSYDAFIKYLFNGGFKPTQWQTMTAAYPAGTTFTITQQPANSTAAITGGNIVISGTNTLGDDFLLYEGNIPGGGTTPVQKLCFTVVETPNRPTGWVQETSTAFCVQSMGANTGQQAWKVLNQIYLDNNAFVGFNMPNIQQISPQAIVPNTAVITYNANTNVTPTGGSDGDIWYNAPADNLYKNKGGTWVILLDRFTNANYIPPVQDFTDCPVTPPADTVLLQVGGDVGGADDFSITAEISAVLANNQVTDFSFTYVQGGVNRVGSGGTITIIAGSLIQSGSYGSYDPTLGSITSVTVTINFTNPNPNGVDTIIF